MQPKKSLLTATHTDLAQIVVSRRDSKTNERALDKNIRACFLILT